MFKRIFSAIVLSITMLSNLSMEAVEYEIQEIGTLQTHSSEAIAINNNGQILGWYNIDGSNAGKHFFVRDRDGVFHEIVEDESIAYPRIPQKFRDIRIDWRYLTDDGVVYGIYTCPSMNNANFAEFSNITGLKTDNPILFMWDKQKGICKLGQLPGKEIVAINNLGQVLLQSVMTNDTTGNLSKNPAIWENGKLTFLYGLEGDLGTPSNEIIVRDMNNKGEVVGSSVVNLSYKNNLYKQTHAVKWINGHPEDLHRTVPKSPSSEATTINDLGDIVVNGCYLIRADGQTSSHYLYQSSKATSKNYFLPVDRYFIYIDRFENPTSVWPNEISDYDCIWMGMERPLGMNDDGEVIALGTTIYGERHAMLLTPVKNK